MLWPVESELMARGFVVVPTEVVASLVLVKFVQSAVGIDDAFKVEMMKASVDKMTAVVVGCVMFSSLLLVSGKPEVDTAGGKDVVVALKIGCCVQGSVLVDKMAAVVVGCVTFS